MQIAQAGKNSPQSSGISITDAEVIKLMNLRESKVFIKKRLEQIDSDLTILEDDLIARIEAGVQIQCQHPISIKTSERRYPSWKDAFILIAGEAEASKVTASTNPTITKSIVISNK